MPELHFGPPDAQHRCAFQYSRPGIEGAAQRRCPNHISFYIKVPDGRGDDWRKAWASCAEHLATVVWQMQTAYGAAYGEGSLYTGEYQLRAEEL